MKAFPLLLVISLGFVSLLPAIAAERIEPIPTTALTRADIYVEPFAGQTRGTLILCPGRNGNGQELVDNPVWQVFATKQSLNLVGLSFASDDDPKNIDFGYYDVSSGSGRLLLGGLKRAFGRSQAPLLIYGFSRGAQFAYSFARWKPDLVAAWCAYAATHWEEPQRAHPDPKGIIACGEDDQDNYSYATLQFLKGRSIGEPWTWVSLSHQGHSWSLALDEFVRNHFAAVLQNPRGKGIWLDVDSKSEATSAEIQEHPTLAAWRPDSVSAELWKQVHQP